MYSHLAPSVQAFPRTVARTIFNTWPISGRNGCYKLRQLVSNIRNTSLPIIEQNHQGFSQGCVWFLIQLNALRAINVDIIGKVELLPALQVNVKWVVHTLIDMCVDFVELIKELPIVFLVHFIIMCTRHWG